MHTKTRTWKNSVLKITELEILSMRMERGLALSIHNDMVLKQMPGLLNLQPILHTSTKEASEDRLFAVL